MKRIVPILLCLMTAVFAIPVKAQSPVTNATIGNFHFPIAAPPAANTPAQEVPATTNNGPALIPIIEFHEVPLATAAENLAIAANINILIDSKVAYKWADPSEPTINCKWKNITALEALTRVLKIHRLTLVEGPLSNIAIITTAAEAGYGTFAETNGVDTNSYLQHTNIIPNIRFTDVPLTTAIENLALQESVNYLLDPTLADGWMGEGKMEPWINLNLKGVTCWAALNRMLQACHLTLIESPVSHIARITPMDTPPRKIDAGLLHLETEENVVGQTTNPIPVIRFTDVPLDTALDNLARASGLNIQLDPRITAGSPPDERWFDPMPMLSLRWENATPKQALVALCENYDLVITNDENGVVQIQPPETKHHHHLNLH